MRRSLLSVCVGLVVLALVAVGLTTMAPVPPLAADGNEAPANPFAFRALSAGGSHSCALTHNATVKCWGDNAFGQLGLGNTTSRGDAAGEMGDNLPAVSLGTGRTATAITTGTNHTCALLDNATVKCWGDNADGQLGLGDTARRGDAAGEMGDNLPAVNLGTGRTATRITAGGSHTCARLDNAAVKCWGLNAGGQLGLGDNADRGDGAGEMGDALPTTSLGTGRTATAVTAGTDHTCALLNNATVKCWGNNGSGRLGLGDTNNRGDAAGEMGNSLPAVSLGTGRTATAVTAGADHTCAVLDNATVKCWGNNGSGRLGLGDTTARGSGANQMGDNLPAVSLGTGRTATAVTAGSGHTCARLDNATVKCWGNNGSGRLGLGDTTARGSGANQMGDNLPALPLGTGRVAAAVTTGTGHSCAVLDNAAVKCWGANGSGRLGLGDTLSRGDGANEMGDNLPAVPQGTARTASALSGEYNHTCALLDNGTVKCWGQNFSGQLGLNNDAARGDTGGEMGDALRAVDLGTGRTATTVTTVTTGSAHTCALLDNATIKCWGNNIDGRLGLGDTTNRGGAAGGMGDALPAVSLGTGRSATAVTAGDLHTCALLDNATVKCWGINGSGRLGLGDTSARGGNAPHMGDNLPAVDLGVGRTATAIAAGDLHTCALLDNATIKCWGNNADGQLGLGDTTTRGDGPGEMGNALPVVSLGVGRSATAITAGGDHTCALLDNATVKCWGNNGSGRLGLGDTTARGGGANQMGDNLPTVSLGAGRTATAITAGEAHTCAVLDNRSVKCWGNNTTGQLGLGDTLSRGDAPAELGDNLPAVSLGTGRTVDSVSTAANHTCARLDSGSVKCWGFNTSDGMLGQGDTATRGDSPGEMGDALLPVDLGSAAPAGASGTVTDAVSAAPIAGAFVAVLRATDFSLAAGAVADGSGNYTVAVIPGSYFLYLIDPTGNHTAAFAGPPTTFVVPGDTVIDADGAMAPARGSVSGTVTETGPNTAVPGAFALAISAATGAPERGAVANGSGAFTLPGLNPGNHFIGYIDPAGNHATRFFPNSVDVPGATPVAVTPGGNTVANGSLPIQTATGTGAALTGTVTEQGTATPLAGMFVLALNAADFRLARGGVTNGSGAYNLDVAAGTYKLAFIDPAGLHAGEWHNNQPLTNLAGAASVTAPVATNAALDPSTGTVAGTITDQMAATPIAGAWVLAIGPTGVNGGAITAANGSYAITGLPPGTYRAAIIDPSGGHLLEYFDNSPDITGADTFNITAAATTNINAALAFP